MGTTFQAQLTMRSVLLDLGEEVPAGGPTPPTHGPARYQDRGLLGAGGMGEVRRVFDQDLGRTVAMKIMHPGAVSWRFVEEARTTAGLAHPSIVAVHEMGRLPDGRLYFTMQEVRGRTLAEMQRSWPLRRLVEALRQVAEAVACAHDAGVLHRDLKPANVMIGSYGEVLVVDWGLARGAGRGPAALSGAPQHTVQGQVLGTPFYMAPEAARGDLELVGPGIDVYALGAILYQLLSGRPPYEGAGDTALGVVEAVREGPPAALPVRPERADLVALCTRAMARAPSARLPTAEAFAQGLTDWLDGASKRERALEVLGSAQALELRLPALRRAARQWRERAEQALAGVAPWDQGEVAVARRAQAWEAEDRAQEEDDRALQAETQAVQLLHGALTHDPELEEAHRRLARWYRRRHAEAEACHDRVAASRAEAALRVHDRAGEHQAYLKGDGRFDLITEPAGLEVVARPFVERGRRLEPGEGRALGVTPLRGQVLPRGSWLLEISSPTGGRPSRCPLALGRGEALPSDPGGEQPLVIPTSMPQGELWVPAGWMWAGGDPRAVKPLPRRRVWVDSFVIQRDPVTNEDYIRFLDDLVAHGREADALRWQPLERGGGAIYGRRSGGGFRCQEDADGFLWEPQMPVLMVDWWAAQAYARWVAQQTGLPWALPWAIQWEKAARGVDGRFYPWGDHFEAAWACTRASKEAPLPDRVDRFALDVGPYGMRGAAGNVACWCLDPWVVGGTGPSGERLGPSEPVVAEAKNRCVRGGAWLSDPDQCRLANHQGQVPGSHNAGVGIRLVRWV